MQRRIPGASSRWSLVIALALLSLGTGPVARHAIPGEQLWASTYHGQGEITDEADGMAVSPDGTRGFVTDAVTSDLQYAPPTAERRIMLAFDTATGRRLWARPYDGGRYCPGSSQVVISPDGGTVFARLFCTTAAGSHVWLDTARLAGTGVPIWSRTRPAGADNAQLAVSVDGRLLFAAGGEPDGPRDLFAYDVSTGTVAWAADYAPVGPLTTSPDGSTLFVMGGCDVAALSAAYGSLLWRRNGTSCYSAWPVIAGGQGGPLILAGVGPSGDGHVQTSTTALDPTSGRLLWSEVYVAGHVFGSEAPRLATSADGGVVVVSSGASTTAYAASTGDQLWAVDYSSIDSAGKGLAISSDGSTAYVAGSAGLTAYAVYSGTEKWSDGSSVMDIDAIAGAGGHVVSVGGVDGVVSDEDVALASRSEASSATVWSRTYNGPGGYLDTPWSVAISPDGSRVFVAGEVDTSPHTVAETVAYDAATGAKLWARTLNDSAAHAVVTGPDGATVYAADGASLIAYDAATGRRRWLAAFAAELPSNNRFIVAVKVSASGSTVVATGTAPGADGYSLMWVTCAFSAATGDPLWEARSTPRTERPLDMVEDLAISPDGNRAYVTGVSFGKNSFDVQTIAYDTASGTQVWIAPYYHGSAGEGWGTALAVSPDGSCVVVAGIATSTRTGTDFETISYDATTGAQIWAKSYAGFSSYTDTARSVAISPDGSTTFVNGFVGYASGVEIATVAYDSATGDQLWAQRYRGPQNESFPEEHAIAVTPDGSQVLTTGVSKGSTGRDWATIAMDAKTGKQLWVNRYGDPPTEPAYAQSLAIAPDGSKAIVIGTTSQPDKGSVIRTAAYSLN